ncbi:MAG: hypothetical protein VXU46_01450 [Planctomycetota bacterium]|nr:hypothetical protein [Planctomycetota bacterium]
MKRLTLAFFYGAGRTGEVLNDFTCSHELQPSFGLLSLCHILRSTALKWAWIVLAKEVALLKTGSDVWTGTSPLSPICDSLFLCGLYEATYFGTYPMVPVQKVSFTFEL